MKETDGFLIKLVNLWFCQDEPQESINDSMKNWAMNLLEMTVYGDDRVYSHPKINEIIILCKDYGIFEYEKSIMEIYFEGRMKMQMRIREMFNTEEVKEELKALFNVLGTLAKQIEKKVKKQLEDEKNMSAIPELIRKGIIKN
jgi:hypothetical protein